MKFTDKEKDQILQLNSLLESIEDSTFYKLQDLDGDDIIPSFFTLVGKAMEKIADNS